MDNYELKDFIATKYENEKIDLFHTTVNTCALCKTEKTDVYKIIRNNRECFVCSLCVAVIVEKAFDLVKKCI